MFGKPTSPPILALLTTICPIPFQPNRHMKFSAHLLAALAICCSGPGTLTAAPPPEAPAPAPAAATPPLATNQLDLQDLLTEGDKAFQQKIGRAHV